MSSYTEQLKNELNREVHLNIDYERWIKKLQKSLDEDEKVIFRIEQEKKDLIENNISLKQEILNLKKEVNALKRLLREKDKQLLDREENISNLEEDIIRLKNRIRNITIVKEKMVRSSDQDSCQDIITEAGQIKQRLVAYIERQANFRPEQKQIIEHNSDQLVLIGRILQRKCGQLESDY